MLKFDGNLDFNMGKTRILAVQVIEVLGTPLGTDIYIKDFVVHNCVKIARNVEQLEPITDVFAFHQQNFV